MTTTLIVLKDLAREFNIDPHKLRSILRSNADFQKNGRWKWKPDDPLLHTIRTFLRTKT